MGALGAYVLMLTAAAAACVLDGMTAGWQQWSGATLTAGVVFIFQWSERRLCRLKFEAELLRFFDPLTAPGRAVTEFEQTIEKNCARLFGRDEYASRLLPLPWLLVITTACVLATFTVQSVYAASHPQDTTITMQDPTDLPSTMAIPLPGTLPPLTNDCRDTKEVHNQLVAGLPALAAAATIKVWRHDGARLLGCPMTLPARWQQLWIIPLSGGTIPRAFIVVNPLGAAAVVHDDFSNDIWAELSAGQGAIVYGRVTWPPPSGSS